MIVKAKLEPSTPELIRASKIRVGYQANLFGTTYEVVCPPERVVDMLGTIEICLRHTESKEILYIKIPEDLGISVSTARHTAFKEIKDFLPGELILRNGKLGTANVDPDYYGILFHGDVDYTRIDGDAVGCPVEVSE